jgi:hypothetical protein
MEDFHYSLKHISRVYNHTDALSWRPDHNDGLDNNEQVVALPDNVFARTISTVTLDKKLRKQQGNEHCLISEWKDKYHLCQKEDAIWFQGDMLVVVGGVEDHWALLAIYHNALMAGHPRVTKTLKALKFCVSVC